MTEIIIYPVAPGADGVLEVQDDPVFSSRDLAVIASVEGLAVRSAPVRWRDEVRSMKVYQGPTGGEFVRVDELPALDEG